MRKKALDPDIIRILAVTVVPQATHGKETWFPHKIVLMVKCDTEKALSM